MNAVIYYDGECPFCRRYVRYLSLQKTVDTLRIVDLRTSPDALQSFMALGINVDGGMVLELDGKLHWGTDAAHRLALLSTPSGTFNRINRWMLGHRIGASLIYPLLRMGRAVVLLMLGRQAINHMETAGDQARMTLFGMAWGVFAFLHALVYATQFNLPMHASTWVIAPIGVALIFFPTSKRLFLLLLSAMLVDAWAHLPMHSNHTLLKNVFLHALALSSLWHAWRGQSWERFFEDAASVGRAALLCMYVFGVFHKINTDFLNPQVSCALALWIEMPPWLSWISGSWFEVVAIYGTLVIETFILLCLLIPRTRHLGIVLGIGFHSLLALSGYALYASFSTLTIALHLLFVDKETALRVTASFHWQAWMDALRRPAGLSLLFCWLTAIGFLAWNGSYSSVGLAWLPAPLLLCYALIRYGKGTGPAIPNLVVSRLWWLNLISVLMVATCFKPYLGLPTAQSMNMFANLRLEANVSNHLVLRSPPAPFSYLEDVVALEEAGGSSYLVSVHLSGMTVTWHDLLDKLDRTPDSWASFHHNGRYYKQATAETLAVEIERTLPPRWVRNWLHFNPVDLRQPKPCALGS